MWTIAALIAGYFCPAGLLVCIVAGYAACRILHWWNDVPTLTDDEVQELFNQYLLAEALDDEPQAAELLRDLRCEGITVFSTAAGVFWERI